MPCKQCENGKWKWGDNGPCKYDSREECERDNEESDMAKGNRARQPARNVARLSANEDGTVLRLYGIVGDDFDGFTDDQVRDLLDGVSGPLTVQLNSPGGMVWMGMAVYTALREVGDVTIQVDGIAASIASVIAMAGTVRMHPGSMMMVHNPWNIALGDAEEMRKNAEMLDKVGESILAIYMQKTGQDRDTIKTMMDEETWLTAQEAIEWGFADELVDTDDSEAAARAMAQLDLSILPALDTRVAVAVARHKITGTARGDRAAEPSASEPPKPTGDPPMTAKTGQHASAADPNAADPKNPDPSAAAPEPQPDAETARDEAVKAERARVAEIQRSVRAAKLPQDFADELIKAGTKIEDARAKIIDKWAEQEQAQPETFAGHRVEVGADDREKLRQGAVSAILARAGVQKPDPQNEFRGCGFLSLARASLERAGAGVPYQDKALVKAAVTTSTSDYPNILEDAMHKLLLDAFRNAPDTWSRWCRVGDLADFRDHHRHQPGSIANIKKLKEDGELEHSYVPDSEKETISADERGLIVPISYAMMVNDDMGAFTTLVRDLGRAGARTIEKAVYDLLISNPTMSDGSALFHTADHGNLASSGTAISTGSVSTARAAIRTQKDPSGNEYIAPAIGALLVPEEIWDVGQQLMMSEVDPAKSNRTPNIVRNIAEVVSTPYLSANSTTAWYLMAEPADAPTIEVGFVNGEQEPMVEQEEQFTTRGILYRVTHDWGTAAIGYRGAYKNPGA